MHMRRMKAFVGLALASTYSMASATGLDFDRTFDTQHEPPQISYVATYRAGAEEHRVEVWRDREVRIKRRTDDAIETYLERPRDDDEWTMTMLDLKRRIRTDVDRTNLFRIGHFVDWFSEAHALARPRGSYDLHATNIAVRDAKPIVACDWYELVQVSRSTKICWSKSLDVPLVIVDGRGRVVWRVTRIESRSLAANAFDIDDRGFVRNDANADIQGD
jgi:hypothetical protein